MTSSRNTYAVVFRFDNNRKSVYVPGALCDVQHGFWVTKAFRFTYGDDNEYWIPPSAILYIRKIRYKDPEPAAAEEAIG